MSICILERVLYTIKDLSRHSVYNYIAFSGFLHNLFENDINYFETIDIITFLFVNI